MSLEKDKNVYIKLLKTLNSGKNAVIITTFNGKENSHKSTKDVILLTEEELLSSLSKEDILYEKAKYALETGNLQFIENEDNGILLIEPYFPEPQLIVLGGGHIAKPLVEFSAKVGFSVTVVDDRPFFANNNRFPDARKVICESFESCFKTISLNTSSFVVIITRGHRHDLHCLKESLKYDTAYVGMIGSKRRIKIIREQLLEEGYAEEHLNKVNAPIGLDIDAVSPEEIAISILAQLISYKRRRISQSDSSMTRKMSFPEFDATVIESLANASEDPKAIATIISTKGSVPRKSGAKMIIYPDGRTLGSIGGGCSEGEVITAARDIIKDKGHRIMDVDMTGIIAEEEGMVCGGTMKVLIESIMSH